MSGCNCEPLRQRVAELESALSQVWREFNEIAEESGRLRQRISELESWMREANRFMWAHEHGCPMRTGGVCNCGLHEFLSKPRPVIGTHLERIAELELQLAEARKPRSCDHLRDMKPNWNSYGAPPPTEAAIRTAEVMLSVPTVVPRSNGGVQLEWHTGDRDIEIAINPDGGLEFETELADARKDTEKMRAALMRAQEVGVFATWSCGFCRDRLRNWIESGMSESLPDLCVLGGGTSTNWSEA